MYQSFGKLDLKPKTPEEYVHLVDQAIIELEELIATYDYDIEDAGAQHKYLEPLLNMVRDVRRGMSDGSYEFTNEDLPFMALVTRYRTRLPFADLLTMINHTHRNGLSVETLLK
jgi:hypothetical protein